jgi:hypothetical protein
MPNQISPPVPICRHDERLTHARLSEEAKSVLMDWFELAPGEAETLVASWAGKCQVPACELAEALTRGVCQGRATGCSPAVLRQVEDLLRRLPTRPPHAGPP